MLSFPLGRFVPQALALWRRQRLQAALAVLATAAGVGGLAAVISVGQGARAELDRALGALGTSTLIVRSIGAPSIGTDRTDAVGRLLEADLENRVAVTQRLSVAASALRELPGIRVVATERAYAAAYGLALAAGRFVAGQDVARQARVCVLGAALAAELFPRGDALGSAVRLDASWYDVVGVLAPSGGRAAMSPELVDTDRLAIVPLEPVTRRVPLDELVLKFRDETEMTRAVAAVQRIVEYGGSGSRFEYVMPAELIRQKFHMQRIVGWLLAGVTAVLLAVGGISIANVMLLSVLRRKSEIGLRRAVGASRNTIIQQFLCEGLLLCGVGGIVGAALGLAATLSFAAGAGWPVASVGTAALGGFGVSLLVGLAASSYPAWAASRVEPMRALA